MTAADSDFDPYVALTRFGLGPRAGEASTVANDPRGFVLAQLERPKSVLISTKLPTSRTAIAAAENFQSMKQKGKTTDAMTTPAVDIYKKEVVARAQHAVAVDDGFVERLVMFWSNFFTVSGERGPMVHASVGAFEREVIRPNVLGKFSDMLLAATMHPTMLTYLDNNSSIGPHSFKGNHGNGLNENLARETLELHSVGVDGGYTQADVTSLAKIITGWRSQGSRQHDGTFYFDMMAHEPGAFTVMGKTYSQFGVKQGTTVLADLARKPPTAQHVATRMAAHFLADAPPPGIVQSLAQTFQSSGGDLKKLAAALVKSKDAWSWPQVKFLPPYDFVVATYRATGSAPKEQQFQRVTNSLGQCTWFPGSPKGWPDDDTIWAAPDALVSRADWASELAEPNGERQDVVRLADDILGPRLQPATRDAVDHAATRAQGLALLLASSEFQLR